MTLHLHPVLSSAPVATATAERTEGKLQHGETERTGSLGAGPIDGAESADLLGA